GLVLPRADALPPATDVVLPEARLRTLWRSGRHLVDRLERRPMASRANVEFAGEGGLRLAAEVAGEEGAPSVVLFHGGGQTRHAWGTTLDVLGRQGWRAYSVDLRGHGDSQWSPEGDYTLDGFQ